MSLMTEKKEGADLWSDAAPSAHHAHIEHPIISQVQENNNKKNIYK
jgi:hypothetical protein